MVTPRFSQGPNFLGAISQGLQLRGQIDTLKRAEAQAGRDARLQQLQGIILSGGRQTATPSTGQQAQLAGQPQGPATAGPQAPTSPTQRVDAARLELQQNFPQESIALQKEIDAENQREFDALDKKSQFEARNFTRAASQIVNQDPESQMRFLERRIKKGAEQGFDMTDSLDILEALRRDPEEGQQLLKDAVRFGESIKTVEPGNADADQFEDILDSEGNIIAQRNTRTGKLGASPLAPSAESVSDTVKAESGLRKEFTAASKTFREQRAAFERVESAASRKTAAGDLALIFAFMKTQDPQSVVRESEFETAEGAQAAVGRAEENGEAVPNFIRRGIARLLDGTRLLDDQRADFVDTAKGIFDGALREQQSIEQQFRDVADRSNLNPDNVVLDFKQGQLPSEEEIQDNEAPIPSGQPGRIDTILNQDEIPGTEGVDLSTLSDADLEALLGGN